MPIFISQGRYSQDAMRNMATTPESNRTEPVSKLIQAAGGKLLAYYVTFGEYDWLLVVEAPDARTVAAAVIGGGGRRWRDGHEDHPGDDRGQLRKPSAPQVNRQELQVSRQRRDDRSLHLKKRGTDRHSVRRQGLVELVNDIHNGDFEQLPCQAEERCQGVPLRQPPRVSPGTKEPPVDNFPKWFEEIDDDPVGQMTLRTV